MEKNKTKKMTISKSTNYLLETIKPLILSPLKNSNSKNSFDNNKNPNLSRKSIYNKKNWILKEKLKN